MRLERRDLALAPVSTTGALLMDGSPRTGDMEEGDDEVEDDGVSGGGGGEGPIRA